VTTYDNIESLGLAVDMQSWPSAESGIFDKLIETLKPKTIIEVGSWKGVSAINMAKLGEPYGTHVHCVDTWLGAQEHFITGKDKLPRDAWGYPQLFHQFLTNVKAEGLQDRITPYPMTSVDGAAWLKHLKITAPLIYIDAGHDVTSCYNDICAYWPLLEPGGVLFGDDIEVFTSVKSAVFRFAHEREVKIGLTGAFWVARKM